MDTADELNKMLEQKLDEMEKRIIMDKEKVLGKKTTLVLIASYLNNSIIVALIYAIFN